MRNPASALIILLLAAPALARDPIRPAELPPPDFAGQQYVDSNGCMFVRAGTADAVLWIPRVTREGAPLCDNPPSGNRVPVAEEVGVQPVPAAKVAAPQDPSATATAAAASTGGFFVAVGSFGVPANADRAEARLIKLKYGVVRGRVQGASSTLITVFAGPFADAVTAASVRDALRADGFPDAVVIGP